jgi:hypothetical protein
MKHTRSVCPACGATFAGVRAFDAHRVGPYIPCGRRCLTPLEMQAEGMIQDARGWWMPPAAKAPGIKARKTVNSAKRR